MAPVFPSTDIANGVTVTMSGVEDVICVVTNTRLSAGGVTSFSTGGSGSSAGTIALLAGGVATVVVFAAVGGWYTRRGWLGYRS